MEPYIPISFLNDFIFCPRSIYFHQLYAKTDESLYHTTDQSEGKAAHKTLDGKTYTTSKKVLQTIEVYSAKYGIGGKIDTYDQSKKLLNERKKKIKVIYDGYIYQLYAQYHCLVEMGYDVEKIKLYSLDDNKSYSVALPHEDTERRRGQYRIFGKASQPYVAWLLKALLEHKDEMFVYVQSYYRAFMQGKPISEYPLFTGE